MLSLEKFVSVYVYVWVWEYTGIWKSKGFRMGSACACTRLYVRSGECVCVRTSIKEENLSQDYLCAGGKKGRNMR